VCVCHRTNEMLPHRSCHHFSAPRTVSSNNRPRPAPLPLRDCECHAYPFRTHIYTHTHTHTHTHTQIPRRACASRCGVSVNLSCGLARKVAVLVFRMHVVMLVVVPVLGMLGRAVLRMLPMLHSIPGVLILFDLSRMSGVLRFCLIQPSKLSGRYLLY